MQNHKSYRFLLLILAALLLFSGCKEDVSFILPAEAYEDTVLVSGTNPTSTPTTVPTEPTTAPTVETTVPTETATEPVSVAPTEETVIPDMTDGENGTTSGTDSTEDLTRSRMR